MNPTFDTLRFVKAFPVANLGRLIRSIATIVVATTTVAVTAIGAAQAQDSVSQVISNTAQVRWTDRGQTYSVPSNTVAFSLEANPVTIEPMVADSSGQSVPPPSATCSGKVLGANGNVSRIPAQSIRIGEELYIQINAPGANLNPAERDTVSLRIDASSGDHETLQVLESDADTGIFAAQIPTSMSVEALAAGSCSIGISGSGNVSIAVVGNTNEVIAKIALPVEAQPYSLAFDSEDGSPVDGVRITLVDAASGAPATVNSEDGTSSWPSTIVTGSKITDGANRTYAMPPGGFRFPDFAPGSYRLIVEPPADYTAPSSVPVESLTDITRPDGGPIALSAASLGAVFATTSGFAALPDVPLDSPGQAVAITKSAARPTAAPGDAVVFTVTVRNQDGQRARRGVVFTDTADSRLRLRPGSVRVDGVSPQMAPEVSADGRSFSLALGTLAAGATREIAYAMIARTDASPGVAQNRAEVSDALGRVMRASTSVRIDRDPLASRMTILGRVVAGDCTADRSAPGIAGVRVMMEDGSFALTDSEGRYHFDGVTPGTHVVQMSRETLVSGAQPVDCDNSTRTAGNALSRFATGQGGQIVVADFRVKLPRSASPPAQAIEDTPESILPDVPDDATASGAKTDWLALADGSPAILFPGPDHSPRAPAVRVVIAHAKGQTVTLTQDGRTVDPVAFDGIKKAEGRNAAISTWRGLAIVNGVTRIVAEVHDRQGTVVTRLEREIRFSDTPARVEFVPELSRLVADGATPPLLVLRVRDRFGRAVHDGVGGNIVIPSPYETLQAIERRQSQALTGERSASDGQGWIVRGDQGLAYVALAPTMVSGPLRLRLPMGQGETARVQELEAWIEPGDQPWTLVGLAEGTVGARSVADHMERTGNFDSDLGKDARLAFYAKGRVLGRYLMTLAYDSAKQKDDQRLLGAIDPKAYYTVYADGSDRRFDAASREKLYVRIEGKSFYALYGDFLSGFDQTRLTRYQRAMTGAKLEAQSGGLHVQAAAARSTQLHRRDEIRGGGITGPYRLSSRSIVPNSELVMIETRDRMRTDRVLAARTLTRFQDYEIDALAGTIRLREPLLSSNAALDPQVLVIEYEVEEGSGGAAAVSGAVRADVTVGPVRVGASLVSDAQVDRASGGRVSVAGLDVKARISANTEVRAEVAASRDDGQTGTNMAWLVEAEHHDRTLDVLAYARSVDQAFGVGQLADAQPGTTRIGIDTRFALDDRLTIDGQVWQESVTEGSAKRVAASVGATWRRKDGTVRAGIATMQDSLADGSEVGSTIAEAAVTQQLAQNRIELSAASSVPLGESGSQDMPARHRLGARVAVTRDIRLSGTYEIARGEQVDTRTARAGIDVMPWRGGLAQAALGQTSSGENAARAFAAFGVSQSLELSSSVTLEATLDSSRRIGSGSGEKPRPVPPEQSAVTGGYTGSLSSYEENFTALTLGGTWRNTMWAASIRGEWRDGETGDRRGMNLGVLRQLGDGRMLGATLVWTRSLDINGTASAVTDASLVLAWRPAASDFALLSRLQYREDQLTVGTADSIEAPYIATDLTNITDFTPTGAAHSRRILASASLDWSPWQVRDGMLVRRNEASLFLGLRHNLTNLSGLDLASTSLLVGFDGSIGVIGGLELGARATLRYAMSDGMLNYALGPTLAYSPARDIVLVVGYNFAGFHDRDFVSVRTTRPGLYATARLKFDSAILDRLERTQ